MPATTTLSNATDSNFNQKVEVGKNGTRMEVYRAVTLGRVRKDADLPRNVWSDVRTS